MIFKLLSLSVSVSTAAKIASEGTVAPRGTSAAPKAEAAAAGVASSPLHQAWDGVVFKIQSSWPLDFDLFEGFSAPNRGPDFSHVFDIS